MKKRIESLYLIRKIGCSEKSVVIIIVMEAVVFIPMEARTEEPMLYDNFQYTLFVAPYPIVR